MHHDNSDDDDDDDLFNRLAPEMVEDLVTLKCNLHLLREQPSVYTSAGIVSVFVLAHFFNKMT